MRLQGPLEDPYLGPRVERQGLIARPGMILEPHLAIADPDGFTPTNLRGNTEDVRCVSHEPLGTQSHPGSFIWAQKAPGL